MGTYTGAYSDSPSSGSGSDFGLAPPPLPVRNPGLEGTPLENVPGVNDLLAGISGANTKIAGIGTGLDTYANALSGAMSGDPNNPLAQSFDFGAKKQIAQTGAFFDQLGLGGSGAALNAGNNIQAQVGAARTQFAAGQMLPTAQARTANANEIPQNLTALPAMAIAAQSAQNAGTPAQIDTNQGCKILCIILTETLARKGLLPWRLWVANARWRTQRQSDMAYEGYRLWAVPLAGAMERKPRLMRVVNWLVTRYCLSAEAHLGGKYGSLIGDLLLVFVPAGCWVLGGLCRMLTWRLRHAC